MVELLVAMTVSLILIVALLQLFSAATSTWQRGEAQMDAFREARGALQLMARDLSTTIQPNLLQASGAASAANPLLPTLVLNRYPAPSPEREGTAEPINEEVYMLTHTVNQVASTASSVTTAASQRPPDLCAVGYFCQWMPDLVSPTAKQRAPAAFALMRQYLNGDGTSARIQDAVKKGNPLDPLKFIHLFERTSLVSGSVPGTNPPTGNATLLASYIWDLKVRIDTNIAVIKDGESPVSAADHSDVPSATPPERPRYYDGQSNPYPASLPSYVEIRFKALSNNSSRRLAGVSAKPGDWVTPIDISKASPFYKGYVLPGAQQFVLRVPLLNSNPSKP